MFQDMISHNGLFCCEIRNGLSTLNICLISWIRRAHKAARVAQSSVGAILRRRWRSRHGSTLNQRRSTSSRISWRGTIHRWISLLWITLCMLRVFVSFQTFGVSYLPTFSRRFVCNILDQVGGLLVQVDYWSRAVFVVSPLSASYQRCLPSTLRCLGSCASLEAVRSPFLNGFRPVSLHS